METVQKHADNRFDSWTSTFQSIEIADNHSRAILTIPLMHVGPNKKGLFWTPKMLKEIAPMFRAVTFRYDLNGQEGSSHTVNKLSSPHFDVGWTHSGEEGAWFDEDEGVLWIKGEVTHPDVVAKLERRTTDGKREVNYASMGVIVEHSVCSICGSEYGECQHERLKPSGMEICYKVPTEVSKALHVALTNDPADGEAEIEECIFQELNTEGDKMFSKKESSSENPKEASEKPKSESSESKPNPFASKFSGTQKPQDSAGYNAAPNDMRNQASAVKSPTSSNQIPGGLATSSPQTTQPGMAPSSQDILTVLAERVKTLEMKLGEHAMEQGTPELVNASPQDQYMQSGMSIDAEGNKMDAKTGQYNNEKTPVNPKSESADGMQPQADPMQQVMQMLQQILSRLPEVATQDMGKEAMDANKSMFKSADENLPKEHMAPGDAVANDTDESNVKNKKNMLTQGKTENADSSELSKIKAELADMKTFMKKNLEIQDNEIPQFGGSSIAKTVEVADMTPEIRGKSFGEYGKWDAIFNGAKSASKFKR